MKPIKRAIILCWIMLIVCFIIKLFGGNWFEIICNNEHFINICAYIDNHFYLRWGLALVFYLPSMFLLILSFSLLPNPNKKQFFAILIVLIFLWAMNLVSVWIKNIVEAIFILVIPIILNSKLFSVEPRPLKNTWFLGIVGYAFIVVFQVVSLITRDVGIKVVDDNTLITVILMIDYYIMVTLYYLYVTLLKRRK